MITQIMRIILLILMREKKPAYTEREFEDGKEKVSNFFANCDSEIENAKEEFLKGNGFEDEYEIEDFFNNPKLSDWDEIHQGRIGIHLNVKESLEAAKEFI